MTHQLPNTSAAQRCPVCNGVGTMPSGFYNHGIESTYGGPSTVNCRSCGGTGIVWSSK